MKSRGFWVVGSVRGKERRACVLGPGSKSLEFGSEVLLVVGFFEGLWVF